jgi:hypothetical protein
VEFLILAVGLIAVGVSIVVLRNRRPTGIDAGIADFEARREALAPGDAEGRPAPERPAPADPVTEGTERAIRPKTPPPRRAPEPGGRRSG